MFQKRDAAVPQFWIWKKVESPKQLPPRNFRTPISRKNLLKNRLQIGCIWKSSESDIFLTFDVFEENFVWRDKTYAPWNCWVITFTLTPCDDFKNDLEPPQSFEFYFWLKTGINRLECKQSQNWASRTLVWRTHVNADSQENQTFEFGKIFFPHQPWKPEPSRINFY